MALNDITITKGQGNLNRTATGQDFISGLIIYNLTGCTGFNAPTLYNSIVDVKNAGLTDSYSYFYQVSEFFRVNPNGSLWITVTTTTGVTFTEINDMVLASNGSIRQIGIVSNHVLSGTSLVSTIKTRCDEVETLHMPISVVAGFSTNGQSLTTLPNLRTLTANKVSVIIGQDSTLAVDTPAVGTLLGSISLAKVNESIAWVQKFNVNDGIQFNKVGFADKTETKNVSTTTLTQLQNYGYIFLRQFTDFDGSYFNEECVSIVATSDYAFISANRTIDKAVRGIRSTLLPILNSPIRLTSGGLIDTITVTYIENLCGQSLETMVKNSEISAYKAFINPNQDVIGTSILYINVSIVPFGTARNIDITIGFATKL